MITLIQFSYSPYCIVQRRILEYSGIRFKIVNIPTEDRSLVWRLTRGKYYGVPIIQDGSKVVFEKHHNSQVIAKYLDRKLKLGLFPPALEGVQSILWRYFENDIEGVGFKLNDIYYKEHVPKNTQWAFVRHKERKFGPGCLEEWRKNQKPLLAELTDLLVPCEQMLRGKPFLLGERPYFVDFDLFGMLGNFLYSGHYRLPAKHRRLMDWYQRMQDLRLE